MDAETAWSSSTFWDCGNSLSVLPSKVATYSVANEMEELNYQPNLNSLKYKQLPMTGGSTALESLPGFWLRSSQGQP